MNSAWQRISSAFGMRPLRYYLWRLVHPTGRYADYYLRQVRRRIADDGAHISLGDVPKDEAHYERYGAEVIAFLQSLGMQSTHTVVDYGCGSLRVGRPLIELLEPGRYIGLDLTAEFYEPAKQAIEPALLDQKRPHFAKIDDAGLRLAREARPDFVISTSVAIHVPPDELQTYLGQMAALMQPATRCVFDVNLAKTTAPQNATTWQFDEAMLHRIAARLNVRLRLVRGAYMGKTVAIMEKPGRAETESGAGIRVRNISFPHEAEVADADARRSLRQREREVPVPLDRAALVLIDLWDIENPRLGNHPVRERIIQQTIAPLLQHARAANMAVIHAPTWPVDAQGRATRHVQLARNHLGGPRQQLPERVEPAADDAWPPARFKYRVAEHGACAPGFMPEYLPTHVIHGIRPEVAPTPGRRETVLYERSAFDAFCQKLGILHLFYAGFSTNICVLRKPLGLIRSAEQGYNCMLLRDATCANDPDDAPFLVTNAAITDVESQYGFSTRAADLIDKLKANVPQYDRPDE